MDREITRRDFVKTSGAITGAIVLGVPLTEAAAPPDAVAPVRLALKINRQTYDLSVDPRLTLLDLLREHLGLTGSKKGCDHGQCGACTVLANGRRINSCLSLAATHHGDEIQTIEGLADGEELHPMQAAFIEHEGFQCGYCTSGQICSAVALLSEAQEESVELTRDEIRQRMSGNICRCGAYPGIVGAVQSVYRQSHRISDALEGGAK